MERCGQCAFLLTTFLWDRLPSPRPIDLTSTTNMSFLLFFKTTKLALYLIIHFQLLSAVPDGTERQIKAVKSNVSHRKNK